MQADYLRSFGFNGSFVGGFASYMQRQTLDTVYMTYCIDADVASCKHDNPRYVVCKVPCKYYQFSTDKRLY